MKHNLKRIETTLHQLGEVIPVNGKDLPSSWESHMDLLNRRTQNSTENRAPSFSMTPGEKHQNKTPMLPRVKAPSFSNHRHGANPALAMNLLQEIEGIVGGWQNELQQILREIQDLYLEGPIVDGWLESRSREPEAGVVTLRHAEVDELMKYVENLLSQPDEQVRGQFSRAGYRLCGLDADGQIWSRPCPPDQLPDVSMAIARHQKLRLLLNHKQKLETRLSQLAETLVVLHGHLNQQ